MVKDVILELNEGTYTPDFYLPKFNCWVEVKGYWRKRAKKKYLAYLGMYNRNIIIDQKIYKWLKHRYKSIIYLE